MIKKILIAILFLGFSYVTKSQNNDENILLSWLSRHTTDSINFIRVISLIENFDYPISNKKLKLVNGGIYEFYDVRSHSQHFLFVYKNNQIKIITDYSCEKIFELYWEMKNQFQQDKTKLKLLESLTTFIYQRNLSNELVD